MTAVDDAFIPPIVDVGKGVPVVVETSVVAPVSGGVVDVEVLAVEGGVLVSTDVELPPVEDVRMSGETEVVLDTSTPSGVGEGDELPPLDVDGELETSFVLAVGLLPELSDVFFTSGTDVASEEGVTSPEEGSTVGGAVIAGDVVVDDDVVDTVLEGGDVGRTVDDEDNDASLTSWLPDGVDDVLPWLTLDVDLDLDAVLEMFQEELVPVDGRVETDEDGAVLPGVVDGGEGGDVGSAFSGRGDGVVARPGLLVLAGDAVDDGDNVDVEGGRRGVAVVPTTVMGVRMFSPRVVFPCRRAFSSGVLDGGGVDGAVCHEGGGCLVEEAMAKVAAEATVAALAALNDAP